jgi:hypothetical protein
MDHKPIPGIEAAKNLRGDLSDLARADNADGFAVDIKAHQPVERKVVFAHAIVSAMNLPIQGEQQTDRMFGHGMRGIRRHTRHGETKGFGRSKVHIVVTGASERDQFYPQDREPLQTRAVHVIIYKDANHRRIFGNRRLRAKTEIVETPRNLLIAGSLLQIMPVVRFGSKTVTAVESFTFPQF